jgi:Flp pilus assembly protein TadG
MCTSPPTQASGPLGRAERFVHAIKRFLRNRQASTAIEFTVLAIPFAMLVFAILESCISFAAQEVLTNATDDIARQLRTGQLRKATITQDSIKKLICDRLEIVVAKGCPDLLVDLSQYNTFAAAAAVRIKFIGTGDQQDIDPGQIKFNPGPSLSKNMIRVFYKWPVITDFMRQSMSSLKGNKTLHFATVTWQNEPFDD